MKRKRMLAVAIICTFVMVSTSLPGGEVLAKTPEPTATPIAEGEELPPEPEGHEHIASTGYQYNEEGHWHTCTVSGCTEILGFEEHTGATSCSVCGYNANPKKKSSRKEENKTDDNSGEGSSDTYYASESTNEQSNNSSDEVSIYSSEYVTPEKENPAVIENQIEAQIYSIEKSGESPSGLDQISKLGIASDSVDQTAACVVVPNNTINLSSYTNSFTNLENAISTVIEISNKKSGNSGADISKDSTVYYDKTSGSSGKSNDITIGGESKTKEVTLGTDVSIEGDKMIIDTGTSIYTRTPLVLNQNIVDALEMSNQNVSLITTYNNTLVNVIVSPEALSKIELANGEMIGVLKLAGDTKAVVLSTDINRDNKKDKETGSSLTIDLPKEYIGQSVEIHHYVNSRDDIGKITSDLKHKTNKGNLDESKLDF